MTRICLLVLLIACVDSLAAQAQEPRPAQSPPDTLASACTADGYRQFDFWLGRWSVGPPGQRPGGVNEITRVAQGCAIQERYHNDRGYTGTSLNLYDPESGEWTQLWVDNAGLVLRLRGGLDEQGRMVMAGDRVEAGGRTVRDRITWVDEDDGTVLQIWDVSHDGGLEWENLFTGQYTRTSDP